MTLLASVPHVLDTLHTDAGVSRRAPADEVRRAHQTPGTICVYFEPSCTVIRLFGRIDTALRREVLEAASDVADRGGPVTIDVAPDADVDAATLRFLSAVARPDPRRCMPAPRLRAGRPTGPVGVAHVDDVAAQPVRRRET